MESLNHLLHLPDSDFSMSGICGIGSLGHIVIHRIIPPVELLRIPVFIHRAIIIGRHQLYICHSQFLKVADSCGMDAILIKGGILAGKSFVLAPVFFGKSSGCIPGKFFDMQFINNVFSRFLRSLILRPSFRIRLSQIHCHTAPSIQPARLGIGIGRTYCLTVHLQSKVIINSMEFLFHTPFPHTLLPLPHGNPFKSLSFVSRPVQIHCHGIRRRAPQEEGSPFLCAGNTQVFSIIQKFFLEFFCGIIRLPFCCCPHILSILSSLVSVFFLLADQPLTAPDIPST